MKKLYALLLTVFAYTCANAQIKKGEMTLGGNLQYGNQTQQDYSGTTIPNASGGHNLMIAPSFGWVVKDNLVYGFDVTYTNSSSSFNGQPGNTTNGGGAGVFVRKYKPLGNGFYLFGQSRLGGLYTHNETDEQPSSGTFLKDVQNTYNISLQFSPGVAYALNPRWQLEIGLANFFAIAYTNSKETQTWSNAPDAHYNGHNFTAQTTLTGSNTVTIGVRYFIGS